MANIFSRQSGTEGFTLIELLVVIAIIAILAATVILSLDGGTGNASKSRVQLGVSSMRSIAFAEVVTSSTLSGQTLCNNMWGKVSGEKSDWEWGSAHQCEEGDLIAASGLTAASARSRSGKNAISGELCCHAKGKLWVIWGALPGADGRSTTSPAKTGNDVYCADSKGFLGELDLSVAANLNTASGKAECEP